MPRFWDPSSLPYAIDWSAWATLVVGIAAVAGAVWVGWRQAGIADRQARIMERQTEIAAQQAAIENTRLRAELYDRRVAVYGAMEKYMDEAAYGDISNIPVEDSRAMFEAISVAGFLLDANVEELGRRIYAASVELRKSVWRLEREQDNDKRVARFDEMENSRYELLELRGELRASMGKFLRLSHEDATG